MYNTQINESRGLAYKRVFVLFFISCSLCLSSGVTGDNISAMFAPVPSHGLAPLHVSFVDQSEGEPIGWRWDLDGSVGWNLSQNPTYTFNTSGIHFINLTVWNGTLIPNTTHKTIVVSPSGQDSLLTTAMFSAAQRNGTTPFDVSFIDQSVGERPLSYIWDFGDDTPLAFIQNPSHQYDEPGVYNVSLQVSGPSGTDLVTLTQYITVRSPQLPICDFTAIPQSGFAPLNVSFIDQSSGTEPLSHRWNFGDNSSPVYIKNPIHQYSTPGIYSVNLTVTNSEGTAITTKNSFINVGQVRYPVAAFNPVPKSGKPPLDVIFIDQSIGLAPLSYNWTFGDESESSIEASPRHRYDNSGTFTVTLNLTDGNGKTDSVIDTVLVKGESSLNANFTATPLSGLRPFTVLFNDTSLGDPESWFWQFGDGYAETRQNVTHTYVKLGTYKISLTVKKNSDFKNTKEQMITVIS